MLTSKEIRQQFLDFFKSKGHNIVPAAPVVPYDDPTLLFTNAGMNQFKDVFLGTGTRDYKRAADSQTCIRVSGKHNDLEEVGYDTYHHTLFEMLGNWSFGDYYKKEAITWAWELLTDVWKLPKERLYVTVYKSDDDAFELWKSCTDIKPEHILRFAEKDNFWEMGETGPCGPCSEIHINLSENPEDATLVNAGSPLCIEIWNLVFIQYNREKDGTLNELPSKHVDTGMGFERLCSVLQETNGNNYDTDVFTPIIAEISNISGTKYDTDANKIAMRVIADHIRTLSFAIADGAVPSNDGRGYVLRRILRRAARYGRNINLTEPFLYKLVQILVENMGEFFPNLLNKQKNIEQIIKSEEDSFNQTLDRGIELFETISKDKKIISGNDVFKLYDTFGFPVDLTALLAREKGIEIDIKEFEKIMTESKERNRKITKDKQSALNVKVNTLESFNLPIDTITEFVGYVELETTSKVLAIKEEDNRTYVIFNKIPLYTESGGQISDSGYVLVNNKKLQITEQFKVGSATVIVLDNVNLGLTENSEYYIAVDKTKRFDIMKNHSATHLLHTALRTVLGTHVQQAGSLVTDEKLRFDFAHFTKVTPEEITKIEDIVNQKVREQIPGNHRRAIPIDEAKQSGALMFFGDKYGERVNVVKFGDYSAEFCGGTHVTNTSEIGIFKIIGESSISAGVRRIEAVTGLNVLTVIRNNENHIAELENTLQILNENTKKIEKELNELKMQAKLGGIDSLVSKAKEYKGIRLCTSIVEATTTDELKTMGDEIRSKIKSGIGVIACVIDEKVMICCVVTDDLIKEKNIAAGKIVGDLAKLVNGGGGGKPHMATAGGKDVTKLNNMINAVEETIDKYL